MKQFQKDIHENNKKVGWWDIKESNYEIEQNAAKINRMYGVLSKHLELVRKGSDLNLNDIIEDMRNSFDDKITDAFILAKISLIHSEISEASYYVTNPAKDKHLNEYNGFDVEMADALIRILDICERYDIDIENISKYKFEYNKKRIDHTLENRNSKNGKKI